MNRQTLKPVTEADQRLAKRCAKGVVYLLDDNKLLLESLAALLKQEGFAVYPYHAAVEFVADSPLDMPRYPGPRCVITDINMPGMSGLELQNQLEKYPDLPVILMSGIKKPENVVIGFRAGASDFLIKPIEAQEVIKAVDKSLSYSAHVQQEAKEQATLEGRRKSLNDRELAVIRLAAQGWLNKQIADELNIALRTVKLYRQRAMEKLGLTKTVELVPLFEAGNL